MKTMTGIILGIFFLIVGALYLALQERWVVIQLPIYNIQEKTLAHAEFSKKNCMLFYWNQGSWKKEPAIILWSDDTINALRTLIDSWIAAVDDAGLFEKKVNLESVLFSENKKDLYISFSRNIFTKNQTIFEKLMCIEGLLKTIKDSGVPVCHVYFFVHHQPLHDQHLDFTYPWPLRGFC